MRILSTLVLLVAFLTSSSDALAGEVAAQDSVLFRHADLGLGRAVLGEPLGRLAALGIEEDGGVIRIPLAAPGSSWMRAYLSSEGDVAAMRFAYDAAFDIEEAVATYTADLGAPQVRVASGAGLVYMWEDDQTRLELVSRDGRSFSILRDLASSPRTLVPALAQISPTAIERGPADLLATTEVWGFLESHGPGVAEALRAVAPGLDAETNRTLQAVIDRHFDPVTLYGLVRERMEDRYAEGVPAELMPWLFSDSTVMLNARISRYEHEQTLEEYAAGLGDTPPAAERVQPVIRFAEANRVGEFFLLIDETTREARDALANALPADIDLPPAPTEAETAELTQRYTMVGLVSFLWRLQPVTNAELAEQVAFYETEAGAWYVDAYMDALGTALREAGSAAAEALASG
ncbi:MAG: hypothetical protein AAGI08_10250 [Bacteroidota bacterium]